MEKIISKLLGMYLNFMNTISNRVGGKHAFYIFCFPFKAKLKSHQQKFLSTSKQFDLEVEGKKLQCYKWGEGKQKLLLVHGWQSNSSRWKKLVENLDLHQFTIFAFDAPGHGNSEGRISNVPLFEKSIYRITESIGKLDVIVSHSIGAFASLYFVDTNPTLQPAKMVALASPGKVKDFTDFYAERLQLSKTTISNFKSYFSDYVGRDVSYFNTENMLGSNKAKGLIIHDLDDEATTHKYSERMHVLWRNSELILTQGLGHSLKKQKVVDMIKQFLQK